MLVLFYKKISILIILERVQIVRRDKALPCLYCGGKSRLQIACRDKVATCPYVTFANRICKLYVETRHCLVSTVVANCVCKSHDYIFNRI